MLPAFLCLEHQAGTYRYPVQTSSSRFGTFFDIIRCRAHLALSSFRRVIAIVTASTLDTSRIRMLACMRHCLPCSHPATYHSGPHIDALRLSVFTWKPRTHMHMLTKAPRIQLKHIQLGEVHTPHLDRLDVRLLETL